MGSCIFAQSVPVFEIKVDSVIKGNVHFNMVRYVPDSVSLIYNIQDVRTQISNINQRVKFQRSYRTSLLAEIEKEEYTDDFKKELLTEKKNANRAIQRMLIDKQQLIAIRDSTNSFLGK